MKSHLKGAVVEWVEHPVTKRRAALRLDKRSMTFFARANEEDTISEPFSSKDGRAVRTWLLEQLKHTGEGDRLEWLPVIEIEHGGDSGHYYRDSSKEEKEESVELNIKRYYIALTQDGREWRKLSWEQVDEDSSTCVPENDRYSVSKKYGEGPKSQQVGTYGQTPFKLPSFERRGYGGGSEVVVAFKPDLWKGLLMIVAQIKGAREMIATLVGTKGGVATLTEVGAGKQPLLLAPGKEKKT